MGLLICLATFALTFACVFAIVNAVDISLNGSRYFDPEGVAGSEIWAFIAAFVAIAVFSAFIGARGHQRWLEAHRKSAAQYGVIAGGLISVVLVCLGALWTWTPAPIAAMALIVARVAEFVGPGLAIHYTIRAGRRREHIPGDNAV